MRVVLLLALLLSAPVWAEWTARPAPEYDELFDRRDGWTGADGTWTVRTPQGILWLFSDTFWGAVDGTGKRLPGWRFLHNSVARQLPGGSLQFQAPVFHPPDGKGWFWVYAGRCLGDRLQIFLGQFDSTAEGEPGWNFQQIGNQVAEVDPATLRVTRYLTLPFRRPDNYGASLLQVGDWLYVYGTRDQGLEKTLILARCRTLEGPWEHYGEVARGVANELSVHRTRLGDYLLVSQSGPHIQVRRAPEPWGPFSPPETVYTCPEQHGSVYTYNAKAHPELSSQAKGLLISYNVNATPAEIETQGRIYRPRFIWLRGDW